MNTIPISSWEGAEAYFTFADNSFAILGLLLLSVATFVFVIAKIYYHEKEAYDSIVQLYPSLEKGLEENHVTPVSQRVGISSFVEPMMPTQKANEL
ncbi:hypothetical protein N0O92_14035 [Alkalihalobacillus sp. MEB130]|uniref:hypothetical protein n=1 Tax=Alkalihalobacillus sp. MEB130 TaxID=2976704 RepID=UPI0028E09835|nr:hypothetical protein [Alkalihalobacillus sp. MEB130]MDT8861355.1 hypothetical protein [Alkalihalobacillus sp. MEB130]